MVVEIGTKDVCIPWELSIIAAFLADDDIQEMTICSTNIGFIKTFTKIREQS
jgi:hypothetical protein